MQCVTQRGADMVTCPSALTVHRPLRISPFHRPPALLSPIYRRTPGRASAPLRPESRHGYCSTARSQLEISLCRLPATSPNPSRLPAPNNFPGARDTLFRFPRIGLYSFVGRGNSNHVMTRASPSRCIFSTGGMQIQEKFGPLQSAILRDPRPRFHVTRRRHPTTSIAQLMVSRLF